MDLKTWAKQYPTTTNAKTITDSEPETVKPFFHWVGGKRELISRYPNIFPQKYNTYFEPFLGGGAVFYHLQPEHAVLSDINPDMIKTYNAVKNNVDKVIEVLKVLKARHSEEFYYAVRGIDRTPDWVNASDVDVAARFLFLNRTGFNGLYRINKSGFNNVPIGSSLNKTIFSEKELRNASKFLQKHQFSTQSFIEIAALVKKGDFVYLDPPYAPLTPTANFTSYAKEGFGWDEQKQVADLCREIDKKGGLFLASNSDTPDLRALYEGFNIYSVNISRRMNSKADKRGDVGEVLISNYEVEL